MPNPLSPLTELLPAPPPLPPSLPPLRELLPRSRDDDDDADDVAADAADASRYEIEPAAPEALSSSNESDVAAKVAANGSAAARTACVRYK